MQEDVVIRRRLVRKCMYCGKTDSPDDGESTSTICEPCLRQHHPKIAERILAEVRAAGQMTLR